MSANLVEPTEFGDAIVPAFGSLDQSGCEQLLARNYVGRLAFTLHDRVDIIPVHFVYESGWIYGRTAPGGKLRPILRNRRVAFEVDEYESAFVWRSVVVHGPLYLIDPDAGDEESSAFETAVTALRRLVPATLDAGDPVPFRTTVFRIQTIEMTGRSSHPGGSPVPPNGTSLKDDHAPVGADADLSAVVTQQIGVLAEETSRVHADAFDGVVVLSGTVGTSAERSAIEAGLLALPGVSALVQQLEVAESKRTVMEPAELARAALRELHSGVGQPGSGIKLVVENQWIRIEGSAPSKAAKEDVLRRLRDVVSARGVIDRVRVTG